MTNLLNPVWTGLVIILLAILYAWMRFAEWLILWKGVEAWMWGNRRRAYLFFTLAALWLLAGLYFLMNL